MNPPKFDVLNDITVFETERIFCKSFQKELNRIGFIIILGPCLQRLPESTDGKAIQTWGTCHVQNI